MIRKAKISDAKKICDLINLWAKEKKMLERSLNSIYESIRDFWVCEDGDDICGCCALHVIGWQNMAEVRSLAVAASCQKAGLGAKLVNQCLDEAKVLEVKTVFALTYVDNFFKKLGFVDIDKNNLPHKVWTDCINCASFPNCDEKAVAFTIQ